MRQRPSHRNAPICRLNAAPTAIGHHSPPAFRPGPQPDTVLCTRRLKRCLSLSKPVTTRGETDTRPVLSRRSPAVHAPCEFTPPRTATTHEVTHHSDIATRHPGGRWLTGRPPVSITPAVRSQIVQALEQPQLARPVLTTGTRQRGPLPPAAPGSAPRQRERGTTRMSSALGKTGNSPACGAHACHHKKTTHSPGSGFRDDQSLEHLPNSQLSVIQVMVRYK